MEPILHPWFQSGDAFGLGDFIGVMHRYMVHAAGVQVKLVAEIFHTHSRTFYMPAREAHFTECRPFHLPVAAAPLPESKIRRIFFLTQRHPFAGLGRLL